MSNWIQSARPNVISVKPTREPQWRTINPHYGESPGPLLVEDDVAIQKMFINLLGTPLGTDDLEPGYGSRVPWRLYEPVSDLTTYLLETDTVLAVGRWMRNIVTLVIPGAEVTPLPEDVGDGYQIYIPYIRVRDSQPSAVTFEVIR